MPYHDNSPADSCCFCNHWYSLGDDYGQCNSKQSPNSQIAVLSSDSCSFWTKIPDSKPLSQIVKQIITCSICKTNCTNHYFMCDEKEGYWCSQCFPQIKCEEHGEGCMTQIFA